MHTHHWTRTFVTFSLYQLVLIIGIIQGLVASVMMIQTRKFQPHQRLLGVVILAFVLVTLRAFINDWFGPGRFYSLYLPLGFELFLPPLLYLYLCNITDIKSKQAVDWRKHLMLPMAWLCYDLLLYAVISFSATAEAKNQLAALWHYDTINQIEDVLILLSTGWYLNIGMQRMSKFIQSSESMAAQHRLTLRRWVMQILVWMMVLTVFLLFNHGMDWSGLWPEGRGIRWHAFSLFLAMTTYYLGFLGYRLQSPRLFEAINALKSQEKKQRSSEYKGLEGKLTRLMRDDALYLNPEINLKQLASALHVPVESLSFLMNQTLNVSFRDYINQLRIEHIKKQMHHAVEKQQLNNKGMNTASILELALASGFNSQASFYRAFKKFVGLTPKQYQQGIIEK